jgi:hypothetical protein
LPSIQVIIVPVGVILFLILLGNKQLCASSATKLMTCPPLVDTHKQRCKDLVTFVKIEEFKTQLSSFISFTSMEPSTASALDVKPLVACVETQKSAVTIESKPPMSAAESKSSRPKVNDENQPSVQHAHAAPPSNTTVHKSASCFDLPVVSNSTATTYGSTPSVPQSVTKVDVRFE